MTNTIHAGNGSPRGNCRRRWWYAGAVLAFVGLYLWHSLSVGYLCDDSFIVFRYVTNFLDGHGLVYNPGERVEGYTCFLWVILLAGLHAVLRSIDLVTAASAAGMLFGALAVWQVFCFSRTVYQEERPRALLACAFLAAHSGLAAWGHAGLETTLFAWLVLAGAHSYLAYLRSGRYIFVMPVLFACAALTRPEGLLLFFVTLLHSVVLGRTHGSRRRCPFLAWIGIFATIYGVYYAWRCVYYGYPLPNTFYAKVGSGLEQYVRGIGYVLRYLWRYGVYVFLPVILILVQKPRVPWRDYVLLLVVAYVAFIVFVGGDGLGFSRFFAHIAPLLYLLVQDGLANFYRRFRPTRPTWRLKLASGLVVGLFLASTMQTTVARILLPSRYRWYEPQCQLHFPGVGAEHNYKWFDNYFVDRLSVASRWLDAHAPPGSLVASTPAGAVAYHMRHRVIDMLGLTDTHIAHAPLTDAGRGRAGHEKGDASYVLSRKPDYILMDNVAVLPWPLDETGVREKLTLKTEHDLWSTPEFHAEYQRVSVRLSSAGVFQYFTFFQRKPRGPESETLETGWAEPNGMTGWGHNVR